MDFQHGFTFSEVMIHRSLMKAHEVNFKSNNFKVIANQTKYIQSWFNTLTSKQSLVKV